MAVSGHGSGVDAQVPDMRGGVCCAVHGCGDFCHGREMDSDSYAGGLFGVAGISGC